MSVLRRHLQTCWARSPLQALFQQFPPPSGKIFAQVSLRLTPGFALTSSLSEVHVD